jgi:hypothetical protein
MSQLPDGTQLPHGWHCDSFPPHLVVIYAPHGVVTIDYKHRAIGLGVWYCIVTSEPLAGCTGRGWRAKLAAAAIEALQAVAA